MTQFQNQILTIFIEKRKFPFNNPILGPSVDKLAEELGEELTVVKLDTQNNTETAAKYGVMSIPTFLLIKDGEVVHTMMGAKAYDAFKAEVVGAL